MEYVSPLLGQLLTMMVYALIGYLLHASSMIDQSGCKAMGTLLLYVILPCIIVNSFLKEVSGDTTRQLLLALGADALLLALAMLISALLFRRRPVDNFSGCFSNAGFIGVPLVSASLGGEYVIYVAGLVAMLNILQWTYGQYLLSGQRAYCNFKAIARNPLVIAFVLGLTAYFLPIRLPSPLRNCVSAIAGCNAPISMFILGYYLRELPLRRVFDSGSAYLVSAVRLVLIPIVGMPLLAAFPGLSIQVKLALLIALSAPVGTNVAIYARKTGQDYARAVVLICLSTLLSLLTLPLVIALFSLL